MCGIYSKFQVSRADVFEGSLVMATMASEDPSDRADTSISSSINSSQSSSTFRSTEDLLGGFRSRPRTPSNANTNAVRYFMLQFYSNNFLKESRLTARYFLFLYTFAFQLNIR